jgi:hypothetical protein
VPPVDTATRNAAVRAAKGLALGRAGELLYGYRVVVRRPESVEWWRARPVSEWPPISIAPV